MDEDDQTRLDDAIIHVTIFKQDTPTDNMDSVYEVFERINTGGMRLSPQEIRSCVAHGDFNKLLFDLNDNPIWRTIFGPKNKRLKDIELVLRFFAFKHELDKYERPMKKFLTDYMTDNRSPSDTKSSDFGAEWSAILNKIQSACSDRPFRPGGRALNVAFYDSFCVALSHKLDNEPDFPDARVQSAYQELADSDDFLRLISSGTAADESVRKRFEMATKVFDKC